MLGSVSPERVLETIADALQRFADTGSPRHLVKAADCYRLLGDSGNARDALRRAATAYEAAGRHVEAMALLRELEQVTGTEMVEAADARRCLFCRTEGAPALIDGLGDICEACLQRLRVGVRHCGRTVVCSACGRSEETVAVDSLAIVCATCIDDARRS